MTNGTNSFVQGIGVTPSENLPPSPKYFTQVSIPETVVIPCVKPDMEDLISVAIDADVISTRLIETAEGTSQEGQILLGRKLIVEVKLRQKVKYVADEPTQSVHAAHFEKVVSSIFVVLPKTIDVGDPLVTTPIEDLFNQNRLAVTPYIEDIYAVMRDKRTIFKNITVLLDVKVV
jgi:hypothetical protein